MNDTELIDRVARLWVELGGDGDGIEYLWRDLRDRVDELIPMKIYYPSDTLKTGDEKG